MIRPLPLIPLVALVASCHRQEVGQWTCPMHPQYTAEKPGDCPICSMKLVPVQTVSPRKPLFYRHPMNPQITSPVPRKDEMGMDYLPVYAEEGSATALPGLSMVKLSADQERLLGLRTVEVRRGPITAKLRTMGRITFDERRLFKVTARFHGYVEKVFADFTGRAVRKGEPLVSIYSPELLATEEEYLLALRASPSLLQSGLPDLVASARDRLRLFGIGERELEGIKLRGRPERAVHLDAPAAGFILSKNAIPGAKVAPEESLFELADLSHVWVLADIYEQELPRVALGQSAEVALSYWPGRSWRGRVNYLFPTVDKETRTAKIRIDLPNPANELRPEMFAEVTLATTPRMALLVPEDAVIETGIRKLAFVWIAPGRWEPRELQTGLHAEGKYEILAGLKEGDRIALGASFLLDSESRLRGTP